MKKIVVLVFICFMFSSLSAFASEWAEVCYKIYIKVEKTQGDKVFYWQKALNNGEMKPIRKQKINYNMAYLIDNCSQSTTGILAMYIYGFNNSPIESYTSSSYNNPEYIRFEPIIPQTIGESIHKYVCSYNTNSNNE